MVRIIHYCQVNYRYFCPDLDLCVVQQIQSSSLSSVLHNWGLSLIITYHCYWIEIGIIIKKKCIMVYEVEEFLC